MRVVRVALAVCAIVLSTGASPPAATTDPATGANKTTPLIPRKGRRRETSLETGRRIGRATRAIYIEGRSEERRFGTPGLRNRGLSSGREDRSPPTPGSDEILFLQNGRAKVSLGDRVREVHGGATIFIPANTWIAVTNIGTDAIRAVFVFSAPGFEEFMRAESAREGQRLVPLSKAEDAEIASRHGHAVIYEAP